MVRHDKMGVAASLLRRPLFLSGMREKTDRRLPKEFKEGCCRNYTKSMLLFQGTPRCNATPRGEMRKNAVCI